MGIDGGDEGAGMGKGTVLYETALMCHQSRGLQDEPPDLLGSVPPSTSRKPSPDLLTMYAKHLAHPSGMNLLCYHLWQ